MNTKSVSITHLVFGLIFLGITSLWVVGATTDLEAPALAVWGPVVLIGAGLVGLAATVFNSRNARTDRSELYTEPVTQEPESQETGYVDTAVLDDEQKS
jgi:hypothetical protein